MLKSKITSTILIVDDSTLFRQSLVAMLSDQFNCVQASSGKQALAYCRKNKFPDLILMDYNMPQMSGSEVCRYFKKVIGLESIPVVFLTGDDDYKLQHECWRSGAADFITKPVVAESLKMRIEHQLTVKRRADYLESLATRDQLTGLHNRQYVKQHIPTLLRQLRRDNQELSILMIDVDDFKKFNDFYGHVDGDKCLKKVADALKVCVNRPYDCIVRYGGEEFMVILPRTDIDGAKNIASKMTRAVREQLIPHKQSIYSRVTVSIGVASSASKNTLNFIELVKKADKALYRAKTAGKNNVAVIGARQAKTQPELRTAI